MRKIEFLAPVEAMRGNLSGSQQLTYPTQNNRAWESPSNKRNYATNYGARYIGSKRAMNGKKYFSVKTKAAVTMSSAMREQNGVLACSSVFANIIQMKLGTLTKLQQLWINSYEYETMRWSFKHWLSNIIKNGLKNKLSEFRFDPSGAPEPAYQNPFSATVPDYSLSLYAGDNTPQVTRNVAKFWEYLGSAGSKHIPVYVNGVKYYALAITGVTFRTQYGAEKPSTFDGTPFNRLIFDSNLQHTDSAQFNVSSSPDVDTVRAMGFGADALTFYTLYRHPEGATSADDVAVKADDEFEEGYVYTFKTA